MSSTGEAEFDNLVTAQLWSQGRARSAGDVVIQNGTSHAWANRGPAPCLVAFVLIDAGRDPAR